MEGIDNYAHLGGWISGMLLGFAVNEAKGPVHWMQRHITVVRVIGGILSAAYYITSTVCVFIVVDASGGIMYCFFVVFGLASLVF